MASTTGKAPRGRPEAPGFDSQQLHAMGSAPYTCEMERAIDQGQPGFGQCLANILTFA